jgi:predicted alpha/beta hydrolase family esterase
MKNAIIVHGQPSKEEYYAPQYPSPSNFHWIPWLQKQLLLRDILTATPEMPFAFAPDYTVWKKEFERYDLTRETILVGHSTGAGFLVRWLSEHKDICVGKVFLVAPWLDPEGESTTGFFDFEIDREITSRAQSIAIIDSNDDTEDVHASVQKLRDTLKNVKYIELEAKGHFVGDSFIKNGFSELLDVILE